jgi:hypothetical protein
MAKPSNLGDRIRNARKKYGLEFIETAHETKVIPNVVKPGLVVGGWASLFLYIFSGFNDERAAGALVTIGALLLLFQIIDPRMPYTSYPADDERQADDNHYNSGA